MPQIALKLKYKWPFEELPASGKFDPKPGKVSVVDLEWRESWIEAFLAKHKSAIPRCLGDKNTSQDVCRQIADMDLVFVDRRSKLLTLVELKKQNVTNANGAVCQLARNFAKARRILREAYPHYSIRVVFCGSWKQSQLTRAKQTTAWCYLRRKKARPTFVIYSGATAGKGREYFVMNKTTFPMVDKGTAEPSSEFIQLKEQACKIRERLKHRGSGLDVMTYRVGRRAIVRFTANSQLRDEYLQDPCDSRFSGELVKFFEVRSRLSVRTDIVADFSINQRLEVIVQAKPVKMNISKEYKILRTVLTTIQSFTKHL